MIALLTLVLVVLLSLVITRAATVALTLTGLSTESARFQARSALTGAGFTTRESELVMKHPVRRRIVHTLMLVGSAGLITVLATLVFTLTQANGRQGLERILIAIAGLTVVWVIARTRWFDRAVSPGLGRLFGRVMRLELGDYHGLLHLSEGYEVRELAVSEDHWMAGHTLGELELRREGILLLNLQKADRFVGAPTARVSIDVGDVAILYGGRESLESLVARSIGPDGDDAHRAGAERHRALVDGEAPPPEES